MAEAALPALISVLMGKLPPPLVQKLGSIYGVKKELNSLESNFTAIRTVLKDAEEQQHPSNNIKDWLDKLKDVAYDVEDILDEFATEDLRHEVESRDHRKRIKVRNFFTPSTSFAFKIKMSKKVRDVAKRLDEIAQERSRYNLQQEDVKRHKETPRAARIPTHSFVHESEVHGRKDDKEKLVQLLIDTDNEDKEDVSAIPIVGMGGLGKTTLAQFVYNDKIVISNFEQRMWVFVSEKFDRAEIMKAMIESAEGGKCDVERMDPLQSRLRKILSGKKYLLVLDNVWNENQEEWLQLKTLLKVGARGSKIVATTRSNIVADIMRTCPTYYLKELSEEDCWSLFKERAFPMKNEETYPNLVSIGREIVNKCQGVPLAAKALGGLLHSDRRESKWLSIRDNEIWKLKEEKLIISTLKLSYNHLPSQLKQCFTYTCLFPKGRPFEKGRLIKMWIAQGFIQSSKEDKVMEDTGIEYFDELCWRSFFQEFLDYAPSRIHEKLFKMHDLIHDLATSIGGIEYLVFKDGGECVPRRTRHLSLPSKEDGYRMDWKSFHNAEKLRTLIMSGYHGFFSQRTLDDISSLTNLRVLDLSYGNSGIRTLPNSIGKLKHLRFLDLSYTDIETLPESICTLWNLQTLRFFGCWRLRELPNNIWKMISLRHIQGSRHCVTEMPTRIAELSHLQTLTSFIISKENGIDKLQGLNLQGELNIENLQNVLNPSDAEKLGLRERYKLHSLGLSWGDVHESATIKNENHDRVIEVLQPHSNVQELSIKNYMGATFPSWLTPLELPKLVKVSFIKCRRCEILPPFTELHHLKVLTIEDMPNLRKWSGDETRQTLAHIETLTIKNCPMLTQLPHVPSVEKLTVVGCNEMLLMSLTDYPAITRIEIGGFEEMISLPEGLLESKTLLRFLQINDCPKLKSLSNNMHNLTAVRRLTFENCGEVESLMEEVCAPISLDRIDIEKCNRLKSLPVKGFQGLTSLSCLFIVSCENLISLGEGLQHLNALLLLVIEDCPKLSSFPESLYKLAALERLYIENVPLTSLSEEIGSLTSLKSLWILKCPNLLSLPESLEKVTTIQRISIGECPTLERRCAKDKGKDWHKIAHVPFIEINEQNVQEIL